MSGLAGSALTARTGQRKRKKGESSFTDNADAPDISVGQSGRQSRSGSGPSRETQRRATEASAAARASRDEGGDDNGGPCREADQTSEHADKIRRQQQSWANLIPIHKTRYTEALPCNIAMFQKQRSALQTALQAAIDSDSVVTCPKCRQRDSPQQPAVDSPLPLVRQPDGQVWYYGLDCCFQLTMYKRSCASCSDNFSSHPLDFGCFPSTPITPHVWYDLRVLSLYKQYGPMDGLSQTGSDSV
jgi:hypothetical protein